MSKPKKISNATSFDEIFNRFNTNNLLKTDYFFIASMFRQFKDGSIEYRILKAKIQSLIQTHLRTPKLSTESQKDLGRLEGLDACLAIIDGLAEMDASVPKVEEEENIDTFDNERVLSNESASIDTVE